MQFLVNITVIRVDENLILTENNSFKIPRVLIAKSLCFFLSKTEDKWYSAEPLDNLLLPISLHLKTPQDFKLGVAKAVTILKNR